MKNLLSKTFLCLLFSTIYNNAFSQIYVQVGTGRPGATERVVDEDFERLKKSKIYFVAPKYLFKQEGMDEEVFKEQLKKGWTYSKEIELISENEVESHLSEEMAAFFSINYVLLNGNYSHTYYELWQPRIKKVKMFGPKIIYASFGLVLPCELVLQLRATSGNGVSKIMNGKIQYLNLDPGLLAVYLGIISRHLEDHKLADEINDEKKELIKKLKEDTLYIVDDFLKTAKSRLDCSIENHDEAEITEYIFPYKIITRQELNSKLLKSKKFYFLDSNPSHDFYQIFFNDQYLFVENNRSILSYSKLIKGLVKKINKYSK